MLPNVVSLLPRDTQGLGKTISLYEILKIYTKVSDTLNPVHAQH